MDKEMTSFETIPQPPTVPILGNLHLMDTTKPVQSIERIALDYPSFFRLKILKNNLLIVGTQELVNEICDESRFDKKISRPLEFIRGIAGDGLFTADTQDPNWGKAHRILMSAFGPASLKNMFPGMLDIAEQLTLKIERMGSEAMDVSDIMTRLTLDTIALTAFGFRFNSFYEKSMHPFVDAMVRGLSESSLRARRPTIGTKLKFKTAKQYDDDTRYLHVVADRLVAERKLDPESSKYTDLLSIMLNARDPKTGEKLDDENIRYQMVTFLIAGHETTSGMLSFAFYAMLKNPKVMQKARDEVRRVVGNNAPRFEDISKLVYLDQIFKETLRLWPTAPAFALQSPDKPTVIGGRYRIAKGETMMVIASLLHRDPKVWADPERFDPDRMAPERFAALPPNAWKPFGNGQRGCIGRAFAMQEAILVLAMILQRFDVALADADYKLVVKETLTLKPEGLFVRFKKRSDYEPSVARDRGPAKDPKAKLQQNSGKAKIPLTVLFGSNSGTAEAFAQRIAGDGRAQGYEVKIASLDEGLASFAQEKAVIIVTASYEGQPPDNAKQFVSALERAKLGSLEGLRFAVFGCGNRDWTRTYQAVPTKIDNLLAAAGAERLMPRGEADARADFFGDFDNWYEGLWPTMSAALGQELVEDSQDSDLEIEFLNSTQESLLTNHNLEWGTILENRELVDMSKAGARSKRHLVLQLPEGRRYQAGDYLSLLPENSHRNLERVWKRFGIDPTMEVLVHAKTMPHNLLPRDRAMRVEDLVKSYVELSQPATRAQLKRIAELCPCPPEKHRLLPLVQDEALYRREILDKRVSVLDILEKSPSCSLSFAAFISMLPPLRPRQYSISSSALWSEDRCSLTIALVKAPAWSGQGEFMGVASEFLTDAMPGARVGIMPKASQEAFHLPSDSKIPIVLACAGTGLAPFRGFLQERALRKERGDELGPALLFFGCDHPDVDFLYRDELTQWEESAVVKVYPAFSAAPENGVSFVQDRIWQERDEVMRFYEDGAQFYVCGDGRYMAPAVKEIFMRIYRNASNCSEVEIEQWFSDLEKNTRYVADVFS